MSVILGVNGLPAWHSRHDPSAALVIDGQIAAVVEEERVSRVKRAPGHAPLAAIGEALAIAGVHPSAIDLIAYPWVPDPVDETPEHVADLLRAMLRGGGFDTAAPVRFVEHHAAHAWSAMAFLPPGPPRVVTALVLDASGETTSGAAFRFGADGLPGKLWNLAQRSSLGAYYEAATQYLGFGPGEEGKTMGLASYGRVPEAAALSRLPALPDDRFEGGLPRRRDHRDLGADSFSDLRRRLTDGLAGLPNDTFEHRADLARASESIVAERVLKYVEELLDGTDVLTLSGGVALNCTINARVAELCDRRGVELVIPPPAGDAGVSLGAAVAAGPLPVRSVAEPFLGRGWDADELRGQFRAEGLKVEDCPAERLADEILSRSAICGWFEGRAEIGPRALGRRSILARPDSAGLRDRINRIKGREAWRPLAPSMTPAEFARSLPRAHPSAHMLLAGPIAPEAADRLAGVRHVDGTARTQVVQQAGPYLDLLHAVGAVTGTEAITCTSFNRAGEPIVHTPLGALASARAMGLDLLAGSGWCIRLQH